MKHFLHSTSVRGAAALLFAVAAAPSARAQLVVGHPSSGAPFAQIQDAIDAALPGQTIHVDAGVFMPFRVDKPLTILGSAQTIVSIELPAKRTAIEITGIAAGAEVRIAGLSVWMLGVVEANDRGLHVHDCAGHVVCSDLRLGLVDIVNAANTLVPKVEIEDCAAVFVTDSTIAGHAVQSVTGDHDKTALLVERSSVWLNDARVAAGFNTGVAQPLAGSPAIRCVDATLTLTRCRVEGGVGALGMPPLPIQQGPSSSGVELLRSRLVVAGGPTSTIEGGDGTGTPAEGVRLLGGATLEYTLDAAILASGGVAPIGGGASFGSSGTGNAVLPLGRHLPTIAAASAYGTLGSSVAFDVSGSPSSAHVVFVSFDLVDPFALGSAGTVFLDPNAAVHLATLAADPAGFALFSANVPNDPSIAGRFVHLQGVELSPFGPTLGNLATLVLGA